MRAASSSVRERSSRARAQARERAAQGAEGPRVFRVYLASGAHEDVEAAMYGRQADDWVLYQGTDLSDPREAARYPAAEVNGIALRSAERLASAQ